MARAGSRSDRFGFIRRSQLSPGAPQARSGWPRVEARHVGPWTPDNLLRKFPGSGTGAASNATRPGATSPTFPGRAERDPGSRGSKDATFVPEPRTICSANFRGAERERLPTRHDEALPGERARPGVQEIEGRDVCPWTPDNLLRKFPGSGEGAA